MSKMTRGKWVGLLALCALPLMVLSGCNPECVDRFDCRAKGTNFVCTNSKCVEGAADAGN